MLLWFLGVFVLTVDRCYSIILYVVGGLICLHLNKINNIDSLSALYYFDKQLF